MLTSLFISFIPIFALTAARTTKKRLRRARLRYTAALTWYKVAAMSASSHKHVTVRSWQDTWYSRLLPQRGITYNNHELHLVLSVQDGAFDF